MAQAPARRAWRASPLVLAAILLAWMLALASEFTGTPGWVHHHHLLTPGMDAWASIGLFLAAWQIHIAAMMLPSTLPMIGHFLHMAAAQPHPTAARSAFLAGYLIVWTGFGVAASLAYPGVHTVVEHWHWLASRPEAGVGGILILAGAFQFSALKDRCMDKCRHPVAFLMAHYRRGVPAALQVGLRHGLFCLGCCWALMLVMFAVGIANLAWMAPLALLMLYEKAGRAGDQIVRPVGMVLIVLGVATMLSSGPLPVVHHHG
ncbi:MAG: DUF2182 domain-containing protein [Ectothiorhodospira sp.]